ncbi:MAG: YdcF family protein [Saprospiraceae bacterium]
MSFVFSPYQWIIWSLILSFIFKRRGLKIGLRWFALFVFLVLGNRGLINSVYKSIEYHPLMQQNIQGAYPYAVVLGGGFARSNGLFPDRVFFGRHINRLTEAMELVQSGKVKKIILSGGIGGLSRFKDQEMEQVKTFLIENQWPDSIILLETKSKNTHENALFTKQILDSLNVHSGILLITSATHMGRAEGCFRKQGIDLDAYSADYMQRDKLEYLDYIMPDIECLGEWEAIYREWVGRIVYKWKGYL